MRILVIEDDPIVGQFVKRGLEEQQWTVDLESDGESGERAAGQGDAYDLIILDMRLPGKDGLSVLRTLRSRGFQRPVLVLTAQDAVDAKVQTLRSGADDYVTKPFAFEELLARIEAQYIFHFAGSDTEGQGTERTMSGGMRITAHHGHARLRGTVFWPDDVNNALL